MLRQLVHPAESLLGLPTRQRCRVSARHNYVLDELEFCTTFLAGFPELASRSTSCAGHTQSQNCQSQSAKAIHRLIEFDRPSNLLASDHARHVNQGCRHASIVVDHAKL